MQQNQSARQNYIQAEVHTATPQKLQLMLIEAAIKNIYRTKQAWTELKFDVGLETLSRAQDIVAEILCSLDVKGNPEIAKKLASIYLFIFRRLAESGMNQDQDKLDDALRVLNSERETWRLVCDKFGSIAGSPSDEGNEKTKAVPTSSAEYTPSTPTGAKVLVPTATPASTPATFARPVNTTSFAQGVKPLGASPIQTNASLAGNKPPAPGGYYAAPGMRPPVGNAPAHNSPTPVSGTSTPSSSGNNWDV